MKVQPSWGPGPWNGEPTEDEVWVDDATGLLCIVTRGPIGSLCGYVGVEPGHPWYLEDFVTRGYLDCHGGVTYSGWDEKYPDVWFIGFDCGHAGDFTPGIDSGKGVGYLPQRGTVYRGWAYVKSEVLRLAEQLFNPLEALATSHNPPTYKE